MANGNNNKSLQPGGGFYYDIQMQNPLLTATLHPNTYAEELVDIVRDEKTAEYVAFSKNKDPFSIPGKFTWKLYDNTKIECLDKLSDNYSEGDGGNPSECYRKIPLITSILSEDFQLNIGNQWGDHNGADEIERIVNSTKSWAPYGNEGIGMLDNLVGAFERWAGKSEEKGNTVNQKIANGAKNWAGKLKEYLDNKTDNLNGAFVMQGTRFAYYGGSSTNFNNLTMRFTLFADWKETYPGIYSFVTVHDQLNEIYPYVLGKYRPLKSDIEHGKVATYIDNKTKTNHASNIGAGTDDFVETFFGWQDPPAGFRANVRSLDCCQKGTMRLVLGGYYTMENLVISDMNVTFSKTMCKIPPKASYVKYRIRTADVAFSQYSNSEDYKYKYKYSQKPFSYDFNPSLGTSSQNYFNTNLEHSKFLGVSQIDTHGEDYDTTPLYADVIITLRPASSYTNRSLSHFTGSTGRELIRKEIIDRRIKSVEEEIQKKYVKGIGLPEYEKKRAEDLRTGRELLKEINETDINGSIPELDFKANDSAITSMVTPPTYGANSDKSSLMHGGNGPSINYSEKPAAPIKYSPWEK